MIEDVIRRYIDYHPETGELTAKETFRKWAPGTLIGIPDAYGYLIFQIEGKLLKTHRVAWLLHTGSWPAGDIDHINGDPADNRISNLRDVPHRVNLQNQKRKARGDLPVGVYRDGRGHLFSQIKVNGRTYRIGSFKSISEAHQAFVNAKKKYHSMPEGWCDR